MANRGLSELQAVLGKNAGTVSVHVGEDKKPALNTKSEKFKALEQVEKALNKQFGTTASLVRLGSRVGVPLPSISTNLPSLDYDVIQTGGIPIGRIIEIYGPESSGKTTLALHIAAMEQKDNGVVAFVDAEHSLDPTYAAQLGVNVNELFISQPDSGEQALETVEALIDSGAIGLVIIDSVAALVPQAELDGDMGLSHMGLQARLLSQAMRKLSGKAAKNNVTLIFINQLRDKIGVMFGSPETTTGGKALKFYASLRLDIRRREPIKSGDKMIGHQLRIKAAKNKVGVPFRETTINLIYGEGLDTFSDFVTYAVNLGSIGRAGAWYSFGDERLGQGIDNVIENLRTKPQLFEEIRVKVEGDRKTKAAQREVDAKTD
jgi:recombination protein RecA